MKCFLMNKNTIVMTINFNSSYNTIDDILEINNINYAPLSIYNAFNSKSFSLLKKLIIGSRVGAFLLGVRI